MTRPVADPLADVLWHAWLDVRPLTVSDSWTGLDADRAAAIAREVYERSDAFRSGAWKLGALDQPTQQRLGLDAPLVAPVVPARLTIDGTHASVDSSTYIAPRLEPEIGIRTTNGAQQLVPCVEIADCRFPGWNTPLRSAIADFGLQGGMLFGPAFEPITHVEVTVRHDGVEVGTVRREYADAAARLALLPGAAENVHVATGAMSPAVEAKPGHWEFEFHQLAILTITVSGET